MSATIDERVVEMRFDNRHFENNVQTSVSTLEKLKQSLNLSGATKGLESVDKAANGVNMSALGAAVDTVKMRFSALEVMGVTALANITNSAVNCGKRMLSALTIDPIKTGFSEYETQINAVQTILANTESKGTKLEDVNKALDTLNQYADKTIYNFTEMTKNIGTFTAAGIDLDTSTSAIQGIANLAAVSGSTSQQASTAMYQLSQALSTGTVKLMDWNSVVNAGMGGQVFQDALKETSRQMVKNAQTLSKMSSTEKKAYQESHGYTDEQMKRLESYSYNVDKAIKKNGSFRESLQEGWITADVLTTTLNKMTKEGVVDYITDMTGASKDSVKELQKLGDTYGYDNEQVQELAKSIANGDEALAKSVVDTVKMASTAEDAATKVKTFSQLFDTLKEAAQSGWTQTWEILVGDFEEAKELLTNISDVIGGAINQMSEYRNNLLQGWKDAGGRDDLLDGLTNAFKFLLEVVKPVKEAFQEIIPSLNVGDLTAITDKFKKFTGDLKLSSEAAGNIKSTFKGVFSIVSIAGKALGIVGKAIWDILNSKGIAELSSFILDIAGSIGDFFTKINEGFNGSGLVGIFSSIVNGISDIFEGAVGRIESFGDLISAVGDVIIDIASKIWNKVQPVFQWFSETFSAGDLFAGLAGGGIFMAAKNIANIFKDFNIVDTIKGVFGLGAGDSDSSPKLIDQIKDVLGSIGDSLNAFTTSVKISSLVSIAVAVGILSAALNTLSKINADDTAKALVAMGAMMGMLSVTLSSVTKTLSASGSKGLLKGAGSLILIATAINILADAVEQMGALSLSEIAKGLLGVSGGLIAMSAAIKIVGNVKIPLSTSVAMIALAESCKMLGDAMQKFGTMSWEEIARGLTGMGGALVEFVAALAIMNKFTGAKSLVGSVSMLIAVQSLEKLANGLEKFGGMSWNTIGTGLTAMCGALAELVIALGILGKVSGFSSLFASGAIFITVQGLGEMADALEQFGGMTWDEIIKGLTGMGLALAEVAASAGILGALTGFSGILGSGAILITIQGLAELADSLKVFGGMTWEEIIKGLVGMGGALGEVAIISGALGMLAGLSGILGGGAILLAVQSLADIAAALQQIGGLTWEQIAIGLVGMGGALTEISVITGILGSVAGLPALLGGGAILLAVQGLGDLADALAKFGEMSWDQIKNGLAAMSGALGATALGGLLNTFSGFGASAITEMSSSLGVLADSVKKWTGVTVPEGLGTQLGTLADGVKKFTFAGMGAGALSESSAAVGVLADGVRKWMGVTIPEGLGAKMGELADGIEKFTLAGMGSGALAEAAPAVGQLADGIKKWAGVTVPDGLADKMKSLADAIEKFSFAGIGASALASAAPAIGQLADGVKKWAGVKIPEGLGSKLKTIADGMKHFSGASGISSAASSLGDFATSLGDAVNKINSTQGDFKAAGTEIATSIADGLNSGVGDITDTIDSALSDAVSDIKGYYSDFSDAGSYVVDGFAAGISANTFQAEAKASAMASAALAAAKAALLIKSPSRAFYEIGDFAGQGFVNALHDYAPISSREGYNMADSAREGLATAIKKVNDIINNDVGITPTIRPVLDLSDVTAGANNISNMLNLGSSIGVMSHVGAIGSMMNQNGQNGNADVVSAIDKLRKDLGNVGNTTYQVNGVTYDDGSNVSNAVGELIRAAKIERRA